MKLTIDRFEGNFVVCETEYGSSMNFERAELPQGAQSGDILLLDGDNIRIDHEATQTRKQQINQLANDLFV